MRNALLTIVLTGFMSQIAGAAQVPDTTTYRVTGTRLAIGQDVHIERDEEVTDTADVRGDIVLVGGQLLREQGARHVGSVNYLSFGDWSRRTFGWFPTFDLGDFGRWLSLAGTFARLSLLAVLMAVVLVVARPAVARSGRAAVAEPVRAALIGLAAEFLAWTVGLGAAILTGLGRWHTVPPPIAPAIR